MHGIRIKNKNYLRTKYYILKYSKDIHIIDMFLGEKNEKYGRFSIYFINDNIKVPV